MPLSILDPQTALVVIDLQKGIAQLAGPELIGPAVRNARLLADAFRKRSLPVVLVNVAGGAPGRTEQPRPAQSFPSDWTELLPELGQIADDICVTKHTWGAFASTDLKQQMRDRGVTQLVLAGVATSIGVESTARQAYEAGFNVTIALDAMADLRPEAHQCSIAHIFPRLGETGTTQDILKLLERM
ncbi:MAG TPA: isochorismatase family protein [Sphingomicrobium sp.]|nr:isochorismatase family protein [Sphingomicrobium sp.]